MKSGDQVVFLTANSFLMNQNIPRTATDAPCSAEAWSHKGWVIQTWAQKKNQPHRKLTWNTHWWDNSFTTFTWGQQLTGRWPNRKKQEQVSPYPKAGIAISPPSWRCTQLCAFLARNPRSSCSKANLPWSFTKVFSSLFGCGIKNEHSLFVKSDTWEIQSMGWPLMGVGGACLWAGLAKPSWSLLCAKGFPPQLLCISCPVALIPPSPPGLVHETTTPMISILWVQGSRAMWSIAGVPKPFETRVWFRGRQFSHGLGDGLEMIQAQ